MTHKHCPYCQTSYSASGSRMKFRKAGFFRRKSDSKRVARFQCLCCSRYFSLATFKSEFRQNKRRLNHKLKVLLCSGVSLRRSAKLLRISRTTVARKLIFLGAQAKTELRDSNLDAPLAREIQFDDQETFEHTKCKPLSITLAVEKGSRRILGFEISRMNAKGPLSKLALRKYGKRRDERKSKRRRLFETIKPLCHQATLIESDENPHYEPDVRRHFPQATYRQFKGQRGSIVGQGELKKIRFDPLFSLNHTCAMTRANINRLFRKTWCTTKIPARLEDHFAIYAVYHNKQLIPQAG